MHPRVIGRATRALIALALAVGFSVAGGAAAVPARAASVPSFLGEWGSEGTGDGQFSEPLADAVSPSGIVYVADADNSRVQEFTTTGAYLGQWGTRGVTPGRFLFPSGIAIGQDENVYVADNEADRVQRRIDPELG
jgi:DNA-binding beta-propeller fold protein YncE